jgi:AcrR family transcriptional regulator
MFNETTQTPDAGRSRRLGRGNMLETEQTVGVKDAIITGCLDVLCREGIRGAEIAKVVEKAGVSESAFYKQFQSKESLLSAFLRDRHAIWMRSFENEVEARYEATGGGLEIIADVLQKGFEDPKCLGIAFINIVAESSAFNWNPFVIAREQKEHLGRLLEQLTVKMGLQYPDMAASAAVLVIERTIERTLTTGSPSEAQTARLLFRCLQHA